MMKRMFIAQYRRSTTSGPLRQQVQRIVDTARRPGAFLRNAHYVHSHRPPETLAPVKHWDSGVTLHAARAAQDVFYVTYQKTGDKSEPVMAFLGMRHAEEMHFLQMSYGVSMLEYDPTQKMPRTFVAWDQQGRIDRSLWGHGGSTTGSAALVKLTVEEFAHCEVAAATHALQGAHFYYLQDEESIFSPRTVAWGVGVSALLFGAGELIGVGELPRAVGIALGAIVGGSVPLIWAMQGRWRQRLPDTSDAIMDSLWRCIQYDPKLRAEPEIIEHMRERHDNTEDEIGRVLQAMVRGKSLTCDTRQRLDPNTGRIYDVPFYDPRQPPSGKRKKRKALTAVLGPRLTTTI